MSALVERSVSRGREQTVFQSSGRGGAGNIRPSSTSRDVDSRKTVPGPEDYSQSRGRELPAPQQTEKVRIVGSGRGGAGNIRSPSRDAGIESRNALREEAKYVREHANGDIPVSHGRGGAGNISNSRSRSRSRDPAATTPGNPAALSTVGTTPSASTLGRLPEEGSAQTNGDHHHSGLSKITNLFHRDHSNARKSRDASRTRPSAELPGH